MVSCTGCGEWYHKECMLIPKHTFNPCGDITMSYLLWSLGISFSLTHSCDVYYSHCFLYMQNRDPSSRICHSSLSNFQTQQNLACAIVLIFSQICIIHLKLCIISFRNCSVYFLEGLLVISCILLQCLSDFHLFQLASDLILPSQSPIYWHAQPVGAYVSVQRAPCWHTVTW